MPIQLKIKRDAIGLLLKHLNRSALNSQGSSDEFSQQAPQIYKAISNDPKKAKLRGSVQKAAKGLTPTDSSGGGGDRKLGKDGDQGGKSR